MQKWDTLCVTETNAFLNIDKQSCDLFSLKVFEGWCVTHLALGAQRMYIHPTLFPRLDLVRNTSVTSSSLCEYWNSALSVRCSFHLPSLLLLPVLLPPTPPPPAAAASAIFGKVVGGCGHTFVQDAGKEPFKLAVALSVLFSHAQKTTQSDTRKRILCLYLHVHFISLLPCVCVCLLLGGKSKAVAMESYPWCRNYGNKAWKASDLIGIYETLRSCDPE